MTQRLQKSQESTLRAKAEFDAHYRKKEKEIRTRLAEFQKPRSEQFLWEELIYCLFAANSSATMAQTAVTLLSPIHNLADLVELQQAVHKKVRFYNMRSRFFFENREFVRGRHGSMHKLIDSFDNVYDLRNYLAEHFLGMQFKESSHYLRNIGFTGLCIIDKHVLSQLKEFGILRSTKPPKNKKEYLKIEQKILDFAKQNGYDVDVLDLALWSRRSGFVGR
ncbi:MAG TPA: hypothetical protein VK158_06010 [Acidobacteriota bacterium]|nr:hypothetical protein [Acidobacteriota bacterium]